MMKIPPEKSTVLLLVKIINKPVEHPLVKVWILGVFLR